MVELFSPPARETDRGVMQGHWGQLYPEGDDYESAARRYWPQCFGTDPPAREPAAGKRHRRTTPTVREDVLTLHLRGLLPGAIADVLNLTDRRVKDILKKADATA
jgi:hypothetical protein